ncbi:3-hydroxyisobutyrate dehydrogenase [Sphingomonas sp. Leaf343]|nr:3-hydroxyisobutyrate dehydrogenase [Sphingomonas sp. Leaf343]
MGAGMARRLLDNGFPVTVWNRNPARSAALGDAGARVATDPADAVNGADVVIAMLSDDDASRAVWLGQASLGQASLGQASLGQGSLGQGGALAAMRAGAVGIECSTLTRDWTVALAGEAQARGVGFLDAPVTGSRIQAAGGALRFLVGGDAATLDRARPVLDVLGSESFLLGPSGSGATLKLINNFLCGVQVASLAEAMGAIERSGLDVKTAVGLLTSGAPGSPIVGAVSGRMVDRAYDPHFLVPLMAKDLAYAAQALEAFGITSDLAVAARARFDAAAGQGFADHDIAAVVEPLRKVE